MDKRRIALLSAAIGLLALGAWFSRSADKPAEDGTTAPVKEPPPRVRYPREARRTRPPPRPDDAPPPKPTREAATDPIQNAMAVPGGGAVFIEVNAIRHSELVQELLRCREAQASETLAFMRDELGVDPLEDVDRAAVHEDLIAVSGFFEELKLPPEATPGGAYGDDAELFTLPNEDNPDNTMHLAKLGDGLLVLGEDPSQVRAAVDRAEGRGPPIEPLPPHMVRGSEVYGRFGGDLVGELLGGAAGRSDNPMLARAAEIITAGTVRVLVDDHLSLSLDLETTSPEEGEDLSKTVAGLMSMARQQAEAQGRDDVAALFKQARVLPGEGGAFGVDFAVPGDTLLEMLGCAADGTPIEAP